MKNLYKNTLEEIKLDEAAKEKICDGIINKLKEDKSEKPRVSFSLKAFRLAAACASAVLVCGTAVGTGIYFGNKDNPTGNADDNESEIYLYYLDNNFAKTEFDLGNVELTVSYGFKEKDLRGLYLNRLKAGEKEYGDILNFEINLVAQSMALDNSVYDRYYCNSIKVDDIDDFPYDKYDYDIVGYDEDCNKPNCISYNYSEKVLLPLELFILDGNEHIVYMYLYERVEYSRGFEPARQEFYKLNPDSFFSDGFMSMDGKISGYNHFTAGGFVSGFYYESRDYHAIFSYRYDSVTNKIVISI